MHTFWLVSSIFVFTFASTASSQPARSDLENVCPPLLDGGTFDQLEESSTTEMFFNTKELLERADFESHSDFKERSSSLGIDIPVAEGLIGLEGSEESKSAQWDSKYSTFINQTAMTDQQRSYLSSKARTASQVLADAYNICVENYLDAYIIANKLGFFIEVTPFNNYSAFTVRIDRESPSIRPVVFKSISPEGYVECAYQNKVIGNETRIIESDTEDFDITCSKASNLSIPFSITTTDGPTNVVNIPANSDVMKEIRADVTALANEVERLQTALDDQAVSLREVAVARSAGDQALVKSIEGINDVLQNIYTQLERKIDFSDHVQIYSSGVGNLRCGYGEATGPIPREGYCSPEAKEQPNDWRIRESN